MKKNDTASTDSPEELLEQLRELVAEAEKTINEGLSEGAQDRLSNLRERLQNAREQAMEALASARNKVVAGAKQADATIRSHPYESLAVALGVGVLLGALLRRRS
ncbi:MAG: DUF883 family protein [Verrucomicrobia bacterium]|nr:DUF883 family protein [Verrucomicrobiota bacterium]